MALWFNTAGFSHQSAGPGDCRLASQNARAARILVHDTMYPLSQWGI